MQAQDLLLLQQPFTTIFITLYVLLQYMCNRSCVECALSNTPDSHNGTVGPKSIYSHSSKAPGDEDKKELIDGYVYLLERAKGATIDADKTAIIASFFRTAFAFFATPVG